jgi:hypothetical protein
MGGKSSHFMQSDRPESGGADRDDVREKSGILEREKQEFAAREADEKQDNLIPRKRSPEETLADKRETESEGGEGEAR